MITSTTSFIEFLFFFNFFGMPRGHIDTQVIPSDDLAAKTKMEMSVQVESHFAHGVISR